MSSFVIHQGLRGGGGIGEIQIFLLVILILILFSKKVSFLILINFIWCNIIFGIIIDIFAELRDQKNQKDFDSLNRCYISDLTRTIFENEVSQSLGLICISSLLNQS
ncbi:unnamed protein product [Paramecium sonneborni]|uniref:Uncharacterized protein n=1 Tax=Paramecium sonneborni TaxID=65129 RepID=A0A8S1R8X1_9CILI|nr:unnamed protein product [Paramecium sonneborni]